MPIFVIFDDDVIIFGCFFAILILVAGREVFSRGLVKRVERGRDHHDDDDHHHDHQRGEMVILMMLLIMMSIMMVIIMISMGEVFSGQDDDLLPILTRTDHDDDGHHDDHHDDGHHDLRGGD